MRKITWLVGGLGIAAIIFATGYFIQLYKDFTQLLLALGIFGVVDCVIKLYNYEWKRNLEVEMNRYQEDKKKTKKVFDEALDRTHMWIKDLEEKGVKK